MGPPLERTLDSKILVRVANTGRTRPGEHQVYKDHLRIIPTSFNTRVV
jgi:hypothetical protein